MKKLGVILTGIFLLTVMGCNPEPPKFGVVDVVKVVNNSNAGQKVKADFEALIKRKQAEVKEKEEAVRKLERSLKEPGSKVRPEDFNKAAAEFRGLAAAAEAELKKKDQELRTGLFEQIKKVIDSIGQEEKFLMIFTNDNVPFYQNTMDITEKVAKRYDEQAGGGSQPAPAAPK